MSLCVFDHDAVCTNESAPEVYRKRCIEADNLLKNEQTLCKYHYEGQALFNSKKSDTVDEAISNEICHHLFEGKCTNDFCVAHNRSCIRNSGEKCGFFIPADEFKKREEQETMKSDNVNHPGHYTRGGIECIKAIEASMTHEEFQGYCKGNVMKYIWRFREKNGLEDLKKAQVYLGWMIESKEKQEQNKH